MPYPNEHAARQRAPSAFARFARKHPKGWPAGVDAIFGVKADGTTEIQSIRFDRKGWDAGRARAWLKDHGFTVAGFEAATGKHAPETSVAPSDGEAIELRCHIVKVDQYERKIFGWLYIANKVTGEQVVDHSGEVINIKTLEQASYKYVHEHRKMGDMHRKRDGEVIVTGHLIECVCFTAEKRAAMAESIGLPRDTLTGRIPDGMWVGYQITDPETWADVLSGKKSMLSLGGRARKKPAN